MRIMTLSLILLSVACAKAPVKPEAAGPASPSVSTTPTQTSVPEQATSTAAPDPISTADVAEVMEAANPPADTSLDMTSMQTQVEAAFAQSNLSDNKKAALSEKTMALIAAGNAGDQEAVTKLANDLAKEAIGGAILGGFGLDAAAALTAIMDLVAAVANLDVAGIIDALMDLVAALGA